MIAPHRRRQAMAALLLSVAAPLLLSIGLAARPSDPEDLSWLSSNDPAVEGLGYRYRVTTKPLGRGEDSYMTVDIDPRGGKAVPDVLVYGHRGGTPQESLPEEAEWLGRLYLDRPSSFFLNLYSDESEERYTIYFVSMVRAGLVGSVDIGPILGDD